ncbi:hypothetical protein BGW41_002936 [Actinomortierella wolfii]|nr:hypothetical protein BGW41_002936 [Actinomortierella wolfii]
MDFTAVVAAIATVVALSSSADAACICTNTSAGRHCGDSPLVSGCKANYIYQCNGVYGSTAHEYGPCKKGCVWSGISKDYCRT